MRTKVDPAVTKIRNLKHKDCFVYKNVPYIVVFDNEQSRILFVNMKTWEVTLFDPDTFVLKSNIDVLLES